MMNAQSIAGLRLHRLLPLLALLAWPLSTLAQSDWDDASAVLSVTGQSPRYFDRVNRSFFSEVSVENTSGRELNGLFRLVIPESSIAVKDPSDRTGAGEPYMAIEPTRLAAGERLRVRVSFERQRAELTYSVRLEWIEQSNSGDPNDPIDPPVENGPPQIVECAAPALAQVGVEYSYQPQFWDPDGDPLSYSTDFRQPAWTQFDSATGRLWGTPARTDIGTYQYIKIFANDGVAETKCGGFRITVENNAPEIGGTPATSALPFTLYAFTPTATDPNGDALTFSITNKPSWASFDSATGALTGMPSALDIGKSNEVNIKVSDGRATTALTPFTITVLNRAPELFPADQPGPALTATQGQEYLYWPGVIDRDGDALYFQSLDSLPRWLSLSGVTGRLIGTPTAADVGSYRIRITASDLRETLLIADYVLNVGNNAPVFGNSPPTSVDAGHPYAFVPAVTDADGATLAFALINGPDWLGIDPATGALAGTPTQADLGLWQDLDLCASDGVATTCVGVFDIEVRNQAPTIEGSPASEVEAGLAYSFTPTAADNNGDALTFDIANLPEWAGFDPATGTLSGTPAETDVGNWGDIRISVGDGLERTGLGAFAIEVLPPAGVPNNPPTIGGSPETLAHVGLAYAFTPAAADADADPLTFEVEGLPAWAAFDPATGALTGTPTPADANTLFPGILITVTDGLDSASLPAFAIQVATANRAPTIDGTPEPRVTVGEAYRFVPTADDADGDTLTFAIDNLPVWASFDPASGALTGTPVAGQEALYADIRIRVSDGTVSTELPAFEIRVEAPAQPNQPPAISGTPPASVKPGQAYRFTPSATDPDGDPLVFSVAGLPAWARFDTATGTLSGTPGAADLGDYAGILIGVSDGDLSASLPAFAIAVVENRAPVINGSPPSSTDAGQLYSFTPTASDPDGDPLTFEIKNQPSWASFDPTTGTLSGTPTQADVQVWRYIKIGASDGLVTAWFGNFTIPVRNQAPRVTGVANASVAIGEAFSLTPVISDNNGDAIVARLVQGLPDWASFDPATGTISGTPGLADPGEYKSIKIGAGDGLATGWSVPFAITVTNQAPVISGVMPSEAPVGQPFSFQPIASDPDGHALSFEMRNAIPSWLTLDPATGLLTGTPTRADIETYRYTSIGANDGFSTSFLPNTAISVSNQAPTIEGTPATKIDVGQTFSFTPTAFDANGDALTFSINNQPAWMTFDPATGTLTGAPTTNQIQTWKGIRITVSDGLRSTNLASFDLQVDASNTAPVITGNPPRVIAPGRNYRFTPAVRDMDTDDVITFSVQNLPSWASFDPDTGTLAGVPAVADLGELTLDVVISASDGDAGASLDPFDLEVVAAFDEVEAALATGDVLYISDVNDLIDAAIAAVQDRAPRDSAALLAMLGHFRAGDYNFDWTDCRDKNSCKAVEGFNAEFLDGAQVASQLLTALDRARVDLFGTPDHRVEKLLLLLGDYYAQGVRFPMHKDETDPNRIIQSLYSEYAVYNSRSLNYARPDPGTFGAADFRWATPETVDVDLVSRVSFRAAGVYAFPGETFRVTRLDGSPVATGVFINSIRPNAGRMWEHGYTRPNLLRSASYPIAPGEAIELTSAIGGPVHVEFGANDEPVSLRFEQVGRHPVWRSSADTEQFIATILDTERTWLRYNWVEFITPFFEIHSRHENFLKPLQWPGGPDALPDAITYYYHNLARGLAGYAGDGIDPIPEVDAIAQAHGWAYRDVKSMSHVNTDKATCGTACSGNPWDTGRHFNPIGHGALHELGHNMQGGVRFEGFNGHSMTNWYSSYVKQHFYNDTGMTEVLGDWVCWKSDTPQPPSNAQVLYEIVQASVSQPDPYTYVRARLRDQDVPAAPDDFEEEDEENDDYPESVVGAVDEGLAKTIYQNLMWMAEHNGALSNGLHLRTLMHLVEHNVALAKKNETTWLAGRDALGMGQYSLDEAKRMSNDDLQLIGMSFATGLDYREPYRMFGIAISAKAAAQVESLGLYPLPREVKGPRSGPRCPLGQPGTALPVDGLSVWP